MILRNSKLILILFSLLLIVMITSAAVTIYEIGIKNKETSRLQDEADSLTEARNLSHSIRLVQNSAAEDLADFNNFLLSNDKLVFLIEDIEKTGRTLGLETSIVSVGKTEGNGSIQSGMINIAIETQGSWTPTLSFLRAIEFLPYRVMISESNLSKVGDSWHLRIVLSLYLLN